MVVDHSPALFGFDPNRGEPAGSIRFAGSAEDILTGYQGSFFIDHPHYDMFIPKNLFRSAVFPESFFHRFFDRFDSAFGPVESISVASLV